MTVFKKEVVSSDAVLLANGGNPIQPAVNLGKFDFKFKDIQKNPKMAAKLASEVEIGFTLADRFMNAGAMIIDTSNPKMITRYGKKGGRDPIEPATGKGKLSDLAPSSASLAQLQEEMNAHFRNAFQAIVMTVNPEGLDGKAYYAQIAQLASTALDATVAHYKEQLNKEISIPFAQHQFTQEELALNVMAREFPEETGWGVHNAQKNFIPFNQLRIGLSLNPQTRKEWNRAEFNPNMLTIINYFELPRNCTVEEIPGARAADEKEQPWMQTLSIESRIVAGEKEDQTNVELKGEQGEVLIVPANPNNTLLHKYLEIRRQEAQMIAQKEAGTAVFKAAASAARLKFGQFAPARVVADESKEPEQQNSCSL